MTTIKVNSCSSCPFLHTDEAWDSHCKRDKSIVMLYGDDSHDVDKGVHTNCPLKNKPVKIELR